MAGKNIFYNNIILRKAIGEKNTSLEMISLMCQIPIKLLNLYINDEVPAPHSVIYKIKKPFKIQKNKENNEKQD
jgi:hypothetical protein